MTESVQPLSSGFEKIRQELDPAYSYMVFEKIAGSGEDPEFCRVIDILMRLDLNIHEKKLFPDSTGEKWVLVVKLDSGRADKIMQEFLSLGLPEDITFYAYGSHVSD